MQKAMYPCKTIRITQKDHEGTHRESFAVDEAGENGGISNIIAPFDFVVKRKYDRDANEVWIESLDKVEYADGTIDYMTIMFAHDNYINDLVVGGTGKQGDVFYQEGTKGVCNGNHVHFECGKGKFTGYGWHKSKDGTWNINNGKLATECLWIDDSYKIINTKGYNFKKVQIKFGTPVARDEYKEQVEVLENNLRARETPNGKVKGYVNKGLYNVLEWKTTENGSYEWFRVEDGLWFANGEWCKIYEPKISKEQAKIKILEDKIKLKDSDILNLKKILVDKDNEIAKTTVVNTELATKINSLEKLNKEFSNVIKSYQEDFGTFIKQYECKEDELVGINLKKGESLYIKK